MTYSGPADGMPDPMVLSTMSEDLTDMANTPSASGSTGVLSANANFAAFYPVRLSQQHTYVKAWWLNGATVAGNVDVGIYTRSGTTLTRVVASTAEAQANVSVMQVATTFASTTIGPGLYYLAISASLATSTFWRASLGNVTTTARASGMFVATTAHPLPSTATAAVTTIFICPAFGFSEVSTI